jgi:hypothetical protein
MPEEDDESEVESLLESPPAETIRGDEPSEPVEELVA